MTTWRVASDLAAVLVPVAFIGAAVAALCALVAAIAIMRGAAGLTGGATAMWMPFALVAALGSFASEWVPLLIAGGALAGMLVLGGVGRAVVVAVVRARPASPEVEEAVVPTGRVTPTTVTPTTVTPTAVTPTAVTPIVPSTAV